MWSSVSAHEGPNSSGSNFNWNNPTLNSSNTPLAIPASKVLDPNISNEMPFSLTMEKDLKESIAGVIGRCGINRTIPLSHQPSPEIVVGTFSGKIVGLLAWVGEPPVEPGNISSGVDASKKQNNTLGISKNSQKGVVAAVSSSISSLNSRAADLVTTKSDLSQSSPLGPLPPLKSGGGLTTGGAMMLPSLDLSKNSTALKQMVQVAQAEVTELEQLGKKKKKGGGRKESTRAESTVNNRQESIISKGSAGSSTVIASEQAVSY
jgi:hypothetical protein